MFRVYDIRDEDQQAIGESLHGVVAATGSNEVSEVEDESSTDILAADSHADGQSLVSELLSYRVGCVLGRWDIRIIVDRTPSPSQADPFAPLPVCSPGMLTGEDGLPARETPAGYPLHIDWDGILVDDPDHPDDIVRRLRDVLDVIWRDRAESIEQEAREILGVKSPRDYFRRPAGFFADHLKRYSKSRRQAPIYWPLSTASGGYTLWIYYHRLTSDSLFTAVNRYVEPKMADLRREIGELTGRLDQASGRDATRLRGQIEEARGLRGELEEFRAELLRVAALPYQPNLDDGVIINAAPLHKLFRLPKWAKDTREVWEKLARGEYDWAHLAYTIWPERVKQKCATDKSIAIAHGLEHLDVEPPAGAPTKRGRRRKATTEDDNWDDG